MSDELNIVKELFNKLESIDKNVDQINIILAVQAEQLATHIKRSDNLEKYVNLLEQDLSSIKQKVNYVDGFVKIIVTLGILAGAVAAILKLFHIM